MFVNDFASTIDYNHDLLILVNNVYCMDLKSVLANWTFSCSRYYRAWFKSVEVDLFVWNSLPTSPLVGRSLLLIKSTSAFIPLNYVAAWCMNFMFVLRRKILLGIVQALKICSSHLHLNCDAFFFCFCSDVGTESCKPGLKRNDEDCKNSRNRCMLIVILILRLKLLGSLNITWLLIDFLKIIFM